MKPKNIKKHLHSFFAQMAIFYLVAGLAIILLFSGVIYAVMSEIFVKEAVAKTQMTIKTGADSISEYIRHVKSILSIYAKDGTLISFSENPQMDYDVVLNQLSTIQDSDENIFGVFIVLPNGKTIGKGSDNINDKFHSLITQSPCILQASEAGYPHSDQWTLTIGTKILSSSGEFLGTLAMDLDYCLFTHTLSSFDMGKGGRILIVNDNDEMVFKTDTSLEAAKAEDTPLQKKAGYNPKTNLLTHSVPILGTDWNIIGTASLDGLNILKRQLFDLVVLTGVLLFVALFIITVTISKKLTTPLSRLAMSMEDIESLAELTVSENEISEAVTLTKSYNRMIQRIKQLMQELNDKQGEFRKAELDALTHQINPHFLYNTLDTIVWLAEFKDNDKIIALTKSLAAFFRLSLNGGNALISLNDELEHVKEYLFIQKQRYDDKLTYSFDIDDSLLECMIPKIILQPIVENAIYHGIKPMTGVGHIQIKASTDGDTLIIYVCDNGIGCTKQAALPYSVKKSGGVGLNNIEKRLKLYYGKSAGVIISSTKDIGTSVMLRLKPQLPNM